MSEFYFFAWASFPAWRWSRPLGCGEDADGSALWAERWVDHSRFGGKPGVVRITIRIPGKTLPVLP